MGITIVGAGEAGRRLAAVNWVVRDFRECSAGLRLMTMVDRDGSSAADLTHRFDLDLQGQRNSCWSRSFHDLERALRRSCSIKRLAPVCLERAASAQQTWCSRSWRIRTKTGRSDLVKNSF